MQLAVSDMDIYRNLTPRVLAGRKQLLEGSQVVVIDTNLPAESIAWLADNCHAPIFADPVSTVKAEKLRPVLGKLHTLKPNRIEAELLSGVPITDTDSLHRAAHDPCWRQGLHRVFISLGGDGVYAADQGGQIDPACPKGDGQHHRLRRFLYGGSDVGLPAGQRSGEVGPCGSGGLPPMTMEAPRPSPLHERRRSCCGAWPCKSFLIVSIHFNDNRIYQQEELNHAESLSGHFPGRSKGSG